MHWVRVEGSTKPSSLPLWFWVLTITTILMVVPDLVKIIEVKTKKMSFENKIQVLGITIIMGLAGFWHAVITTLYSEVPNVVVSIG